MSRQFQFFGTLFLLLTEQFLAVPDGNREDVLGAFTAFQLTAFTFRHSWGGALASQLLRLDCPQYGPAKGSFRFWQPFEALTEFDAIVLG